MIQTAVSSTTGLGAGVSVGVAGVNIFLSPGGATEVTLYNSGTVAIYVGMNGFITGGTTVGAVAPDVAFKNNMTPAEAIAQGFLLQPSTTGAVTVKFNGYTTMIGERRVRNIWAVVASGTSTLAGGETGQS